MTSDADRATYDLRLRTGNWGSAYTLPIHRPLRVSLAPDDDPTAVVVFHDGPVWVEPVLTADDVHDVAVDANGASLLDSTRPGEPVGEATSGPWQLRIKGPRGALLLYSDEGPAPDRDVLEALRARVTAVAPA